ncbi:MAG: c-type cytochrome [Alphaproteobacteria bacterium]
MKGWSLLLGFVAGLLVLPLGLLLLAESGLLSFDAVSRPPGWEVSVAHHALHTSLVTRAKGLRNPLAERGSAPLFAGMKLFRDNCAGCHGGAHADSRWGAQNFYPRVPQFWREEHEHIMTPEETYIAILDGIRYSGMGACKGMLTDEQIWQLANFVSGIHDLPPDVQHAWKAK